jgi:hypothetical protein
MSILNRSIEQRRQAAANLRDFARGRIADRTRTPAGIIDEGRKRAVHRYRPTGGAIAGPPVLLIPPMASQASCFDLHRGCSVAAHLTGSGRPTYLVDYGKITRQDADLGVEFWVNEVLPLTISTVSEDAGGQPVTLVGWCLGGILALLTRARPGQGRTPHRHPPPQREGSPPPDRPGRPPRRPDRPHRALDDLDADRRVPRRHRIESAGRAQALGLTSLQGLCGSRCAVGVHEA